MLAVVFIYKYIYLCVYVCCICTLKKIYIFIYTYLVRNLLRESHILYKMHTNPLKISFMLNYQNLTLTALSPETVKKKNVIGQNKELSKK